MNDIEEDGRLQAVAGATLLHRSRLVSWNTAQAQFVAVPRDIFEYSWRMDVDPLFGRLMCWNTFSSGAEFWLKGLCLLHHIEIRSETEVPIYPDGDFEDWAQKFNRSWRSTGSMSVTSFGTLGSLTWRDSGNPSKLDSLLAACHVATSEGPLVIAAYNLLRQSIRNRDAHGYVANVRDSHYELVPELFARCFNVMAAWLPSGPQTLTEWMAQARKYGL